MTLVVSDNSPLNLLVRIGHQDVLPILFSRVVIPSAVVGEMTHPKAPAEVRAFVAAPPPWLIVQAPAAILSLQHLDPGEAADDGLIADLAAAHGRIRGLRFHVADAILNASLARHLARKAGPAGE